MTPYSHYTFTLTSEPLRVPLPHAFDPRKLFIKVFTFSDIPESEGGKKLSHVQNALAVESIAIIENEELRHTQQSQQEGCHAQEFHKLEIEDDAWPELGEL
jgi:hypothetical protein